MRKCLGSRLKATRIIKKKSHNSLTVTIIINIINMKKNIFLLVFALVCMSGYSQVSTLVKGKGYFGYVFNKEHFVFFGIKNQKERYTPTKEDIKEAEKLLKDSIESVLEKNRLTYTSIKRHTLRKYRRQYVGFLTNDGDIVICINLIRNKQIDNIELSNDIVELFDGGDYFWSIFINITKKTLFDIHVNGAA